MEKKIYNSPLTEVVAIDGSCNIMKTSIDLLPDMAPTNRRTPVF